MTVRDIDIVAHRGASTDRAEHTRAAYELAIEQGADGLECDVRLTRDGHLVCIHDRTVNRTSSGTGPVSTATLADLRALDFASWHDGPARNGDAAADPQAAAGSVLTLAELLGLVVDAGRPLTLFVETKHPVRYSKLVEARLLDELARFGLAEPADKDSSTIVMMSFSTRAVRRIRAAAPTMPTVQLWGRIPAEFSDGGLPPWADIAGPSITAVRADPGYVERAAAKGNPTYCWTVDETADVQLCQRIGVRHLATNVPAKARGSLRPA